MLGVLVAAVLGLPLHEAVFPGGDGAGLGGSEVAHHADGVVDEQRGDLVHVVAQLPVGVGGIGLLPGGGLELHDHQGHAVDKENHVRALFALLHHRPLVGHGKAVALRVGIVQKIDKLRALLPVDPDLHRDTVLKVVHKHHVSLEQRAGLDVLEPRHRIPQRRLGTPRIDCPEGRPQLVFIERRMIIPLHLGAIDMGIAQGVGKELYNGVFVVGFGEGHGISPHIKDCLGISTHYLFCDV